MSVEHCVIGTSYFNYKSHADTSPVVRWVGFKIWMAPMQETIDAVHIGNCLLDTCPHKDEILNKLKAKEGVDVVEGTHPYRSKTVFGG